MALMTVQELADHLRVSEKKVYELIREGMPVVQVGSRYRANLDEVMDWLDGDDGEPEEEDAEEEGDDEEFEN